MPKRYMNDKILVFGDTHFPYQHKHTLEFLADMNETHSPDRVIHMGDILDVYSVSSYPKDIDHPQSWTTEIKKGRKQVKKLGELFPHLDVMDSNHDDRAYKKSRISGIPREMLLPYKSFIGAPEGWTWYEDLRLTVDSTREQIFFAHTRAGGAAIGSKDLACTCVLGHSHTKFGATAFRPTGNKTIWGVDAGCLVSDKGAPFSYNKDNRGRPIQGCVLISEGLPICIPM